MTVKAYIMIATAIFFATVMGADISARMMIAGNILDVAIAEHLDWVASTKSGIFLLFIPFAGTAFIFGIANWQAKTRGIMTLFAATMLALSFFYFDGFHASQRAILEQKWTAATLSIGLLPFFVGAPLVGVAAIGALLLKRFDRRQDVPA